MTWKKLDDDAVAVDQPLSSFVGKRLTTNVNTYPAELTRLGVYAFQTTAAGAAKVKWASIFGRRGTVITFNVGKNVTTYLFRLFYRTTNPSLGGTFHVRDLDSGFTVSQHVPGTGTPTEARIPYVANQVTGLRGFHVSWESDISEEAVGSVLVNGAVDNQIFCEPDTGPAFPFTYAAGSFNEMYHMLVLGNGASRPSPQGDALRQYQVCSFKHNTGAANVPPEGVLTVWPNIEVNPPIFATTTGGGPKPTITSYLYELGRLELYSISIEAFAVPSVLTSPTSYQQTTILNRVNNAIDGQMTLLQPDAGTNISISGLLGRVLRKNETLTFPFFIQTNKSTQSLHVTFRAVAINQTEATPDITFGVVDSKFNPVGTDIVKTSVPVPRVTGQTTVEPREGTAVFMNGVLAGDGNWGMRDAMDADQAFVGLPVRFEWGPNAVNDINQAVDGSDDAVYLGTLQSTSDIYIYGFNCMVV